MINVFKFFQNISEFLVFLKQWEKEAKEQELDFITDSTCYGLKVSLKAALEICEFLIGECDFEFLMTARLNQDNLEVKSLKYYQLIFL